MNKTELVEQIAKDAEISKAAADKAVRSFIATVQKEVKKGNDVALVGFGTFSRSSFAARNGINPSTGEKIKIKARKAPKFKAGKSFKDMVNGKK